MKQNPLQEKYLIFKIKHSKDPDAYAKLYDFYIDRIYRFVLFKVSRIEDAEDITTEVFLKTWQYIRTTDKRIANLNSLLYRMARNSVIDHYRSKQRTEKSLSEEEQFKQIIFSHFPHFAKSVLPHDGQGFPNSNLKSSSNI